MDIPKYNLLLADDDPDDCLFFRDALEELPVAASLTTVNDGAALMHHLHSLAGSYPDVLFLDLNMPRKTGYQCLAEIKGHELLRALPVIIFSTSFDYDMARKLHNDGAHYFIRKPADFARLKELIHQAILLCSNYQRNRQGMDEFILNST